MKKLFLASLLFTSAVAFAYTQTDVQNATYLSGEGIITSQSTTAGYRLDDTITRAEVVGIALKIKGTSLPNNYFCKNYFTDVKYDAKNNWICRAMEIAGDSGIIARTNTKARPQDRITRAEALAIVMKASGEEIGMGGASGYKYYFDANLYKEGGVGYKNAYIFGANWQAEVFYQYIRNIVRDDTLLKQDPLANKDASRAEVFDFIRNLLKFKQEQDSKLEIKIENNNVVLYENDVKINSLTNDAKSYYSTPCEVGDTFVSYSLVGQSSGKAIIKKSFGLCDADGGNMYLFFQNGILVNLVSTIKTRFGITLSNITSVKILNQQIVIKGYYSNNSCTDSPECSPGFSTNSPEIKILSTPTSSSSGIYEWTTNISNF